MRRSWEWNRSTVSAALALTLALSACGSSPLKPATDAALDVASGAGGSGGAPGHDGSADDIPSRTDAADVATDAMIDASVNPDRAADMASASDARSDAVETGGAVDAPPDTGAPEALPFGSCNGQPNPDIVAPNDAGVPPVCSLAASVSIGLPCTTDCCVPCGIDLSGLKTCTCSQPGLPYNNCTCAPPASFPAGLTGGLCIPQGYSGAVPAAAPPGSISLEGVPCTIINSVCFTAESTITSGRGCICLRDGTMHCGPVNHWFTQIPGTTPYN
jgi:hypothetical protein